MARKTPATGTRRAATRAKGTRQTRRGSAPGASPKAGRMLPPEGGATVRMYRQGLGDCFLICFRRDDGRPAYLMIDCGVITGQPEDERVNIRTVAENIAAETGGHLDILAVTHEHWDHVSGFHPSQARDIFEAMTIDRAWFAWTEEPDDPLARLLRGHRSRSRRALARAVVRMREALGADAEPVRHIEGLLGFFGDEGEALGASGDRLREAMAFVRDRAASRDYLRPGQRRTIPGVEGVRVYVLGPPEDEALIRKLDTTSGLYSMGLAASKALELTFFAALGVAPDADADAPGADEALDEARALTQPFDNAYQVLPDAARSVPFFASHYGFGSDPSSWRRIDADWMETAGEFALQLDGYTNNTSLALAIELGPPGLGKVLLFPGDAQVGNWLSWFGRFDELGKEMTWSVPGAPGPITADDLLRRTVLYKVGHHGSRNATLSDRGLECMGGAEGSPEFTAMLPIDERVARAQKKWVHMPLDNLVRDLLTRTRGRLMRIDADAPLDATNPTLRLSQEQAPARPSWTKDPLFFEYTIRPGASGPDER